MVYDTHKLGVKLVSININNNIKILLMFLVGFRVQKNVTQSFMFSNVSTQIGVLMSENLFL